MAMAASVSFTGCGKSSKLGSGTLVEGVRTTASVDIACSSCTDDVRQTNRGSFNGDVRDGCLQIGLLFDGDDADSEASTLSPT
jgi:hypothetical protein